MAGINDSLEWKIIATKTQAIKRPKNPLMQQQQML
jgi:hypothetical protein